MQSIKSLDDNNIWGLYDRNSRYYHTCPDTTKCPTISDNGECLCHHNQIVVPQEIGEWWQPANIKIRKYIQKGSPCPICFESINNKRNALITNCGHTFHRTCLMNSYRTYMNNPAIEKYTNCMPCPICRHELPICCCGYEMTRYQSKYGEPRNELDHLENFLQLADLLEPLDCWKCNKYMGINNACPACVLYRKNGHDWM